MALVRMHRDMYQDYLDELFSEAIESGDYTKIEDILMEKHPYIPANAVNLHRFLYQAISLPHFPAAQEILDKLFEKKRTSDSVDYKDEESDGWGPLHMAVDDGNYDGVTFLLESGFDPDAETNDGVKPIEISVENKNVNMTKLLMSYGADSCGTKEWLKKAVDENKFFRLRYQWDGEIEC